MRIAVLPKLWLMQCETEQLILRRVESYSYNSYIGRGHEKRSKDSIASCTFPIQQHLPYLVHTLLCSCTVYAVRAASYILALHKFGRLPEAYFGDSQLVEARTPHGHGRGKVPEALGAKRTPWPADFSAVVTASVVGPNRRTRQRASHLFCCYCTLPLRVGRQVRTTYTM